MEHTDHVIRSPALAAVLGCAGICPERPMVIAHRGASLEAPENTLVAIRLALDALADGVEMDVRLTADDDLVLMHDATVNRTTNGKGLVDELDTDDVLELDAGAKFRKWRGQDVLVPSAFEAIAECRGKAVPIIDIKDDFDRHPNVAEVLADYLSGLKMRRQVVVIAGDVRHLAAMREVSPRTPTAGVAIQGSTSGVFLGDDDCDGCFVHWSGVSQKLVDQARELCPDKFIASWTMNSRLMDKMQRFGVDAIVTDDPRGALEKLK